MRHKEKREPLKYDEARERIEKAPDETIEELYALGKFLMGDAVDRMAKADGKASALAAYCAGLATITISTSGIWRHSLTGWFVLAAELGIVGLLLAAGLAIRSIYPQSTEWYSDNDWLRKELLEDCRRLRRYQVLVMWKIIVSHDLANQRKVGRIKQSIKVVGVAIALLFIGLSQFAWTHAPLNQLRGWVR